MYKLCTPAMVYVVLAGISILLALFSKFHAFSILTKIVFVGAWTWFLNYLCMKGYRAISWFLVLLPFLVMLGIFALAAEIVNVASKQILPPSYHREGVTFMRKKIGFNTGSEQDSYPVEIIEDGYSHLPFLPEMEGLTTKTPAGGKCRGASCRLDEGLTTKTMSAN